MEQGTVELRIGGDRVPYPEAVAFMERRVDDIHGRRAPETVWLVEHPPLYTAGTSAPPEELLEPGLLPVYRTGRGGRYTYHGPGQRVAYVMLDLRDRGNDVRAFVRSLEGWAIAALARFGVRGERRSDRIGIWVGDGAGGARWPGERKIAAIGVRVRRWITFHGMSLNVDPDLDHYRGIVPCGIADHGVTSLHDLGVAATMAEVDAALAATFEESFATPLGPPEPHRQ